MLQVSLKISAENGFSTTDIVNIPSVSDEVAVLLGTDYPLTEEHHQLIDDELTPYIEQHLESLRDKIGDAYFWQEYSIVQDSVRN
ncbi:MAG: hypothetical protein PHH06_02200 [Candidatus Gracilibacteria bacterium]|nr:hypothetical protein [Candidatus Gracilibacteria bacterium]